MPEDDSRPGLRVGGWVPPYSPRSRSANPPIRPTEPARFSPAPIPGFPGWGPLSRWSRGPGPLRRRAAVVAVAVATLGVAGVTAAGLGSDGKEGEPAFLAATVPPAPAPAQTVVIAPIPSSSPSISGSAPTTTSPPLTHLSNRRTTKPAPTRTFTATKLPAVTLRVGTTIALTLADDSGYRVRHRNYIARIEAIGSSASELDRADSSFTVRTGLGNSGCVSLESVNFPGYFLRHQNFELKLQRRDGSNLFDQDVTFCPVTIRSGAALVLRSINYPGRFLVESDGRVVLRETGPTGALALVPRIAG